MPVLQSMYHFETLILDVFRGEWTFCPLTNYLW